MKYRFVIAGTLLASAMFFAGSCKKYNPSCDGSTPTYNADIKDIIDANCTQSGCHGAGSSRGDFRTYAGLSPYLSNGRFKSEVLTKQSMPQGGSLSHAELNLIQCWNDNGYPEN